MKTLNKNVGNYGEGIAVKYLKKQRYKILHTNYKNKIGEIDIIAKHKNLIIFVEVKYRTSDFFGLPREAVTTYKQQKVRSVAQCYLMQFNLLGSPCRFDVIDILNGEVTHIKNCF